MKKRTSNRVRLFGPGTKTMLVGIVAFGAYSYFSQPSALESVHFEADQNGRLQKVERPSRLPAAPLTRLWKPEPAFLLELADLDLSPKQAEEIAGISRLWKASKERLLRQMEAAVRVPAASEKTSVIALNHDLAEYSELSREYDRQRARNWVAATSLLSSRQKALIEREASR